MKLALRQITGLECTACGVLLTSTLSPNTPWGSCPVCLRALSKETAERLQAEGCNVLGMTSKTQRTRVARNMLPILYARLQDALKKRRREPTEFKITLSHKNATVTVRPKPADDVMADREVVDVVTRIKKLLSQNQ